MLQNTSVREGIWPKKKKKSDIQVITANTVYFLILQIF